MQEVARLGWRGSVFHFPRLQRRAQPPAARLPLGRFRGGRVGAQPDQETRRRGTASWRRHLARRQRFAKWRGNAAWKAQPIVASAAIVSAPLDLMAAAKRLGKGFTLVYAKHFLASLKKTSLAKLTRFPDLYDADTVRRARTLREFDNVVTAPVHGFRDTDDYWTRSSSKPHLESIRVPTLLINAATILSFRKGVGRRTRVSSAVKLESVARRPCGLRERPLPRQTIDWLRGASSTSSSTTNDSIAPEIFKAYDIRGIVDRTLTEEAAEAIGQALGTMGRAKGVTASSLGRRTALVGAEARTRGGARLNAAGMDVIGHRCRRDADGVFRHAPFLHRQRRDGHRQPQPADYNGLKMMVAGDTLAAEPSRTCAASWKAARSPTAPQGRERGRRRCVCPSHRFRREARAPDDHRGRLRQRLAGAFAPALFRKLGCKVIELFCEVDGNFPNHHPDPSKPENLEDLVAKLKGSDAELGLAFDGDGDRLGVVTKSGKTSIPTGQLMLFGRRGALAQPRRGSDLRRGNARAISSRGSASTAGNRSMWKTGHDLAHQVEAEGDRRAVGREMSGTFPQGPLVRSDDGHVPGARLLEIVSAFAERLRVSRRCPIRSPRRELNVALDHEGENTS